VVVLSSVVVVTSDVDVVVVVVDPESLPRTIANATNATRMTSSAITAHAQPGTAFLGSC